MFFNAWVCRANVLRWCWQVLVTDSWYTHIYICYQATYLSPILPTHRNPPPISHFHSGKKWTIVRKHERGWILDIPLLLRISTRRQPSPWGNYWKCRIHSRFTSLETKNYVWHEDIYLNMAPSSFYGKKPLPENLKCNVILFCEWWPLQRKCRLKTILFFTSWLPQWTRSVGNDSLVLIKLTWSFLCFFMA